LIGVIQLVAYLDDPLGLGPAAAATLLSPLYGHALQVAILEPRRRALADRDPN
jgi:flagellar motor component MotA